jgi:hypothetical protein
MLVRARVLRRARKGKERPTKGWLLNHFKVYPTPWKLGLHHWKL